MNLKPATHPLELTIERILPGGFGLAHAEGKTIFVSLAAPGDVARVNIDRVRGNIAFASIVEIIKPSEQRIEPPCPYFGRCGGCDFQQLNYQAQLDAKVEIIRDCLHRIAGIAEPPEISIHAAPNQWHYRARANWQVDQSSGEIGYFEAGSHRVCDVEVCAVLNPKLESVLEQIRRDIREGSITNLPRDVRAAVSEDDVSVAPPVAGFLPNDVHRIFSGETYWFNADSFFQVNPDLLEAMLSAALEGEAGELAIDLYCGAGLFTLPLARRFAKVVGVEVNSHATSFARRNLAAAQLSNAEVFTTNVGDWLRNLTRPLPFVDFLLLDPPRTGAENAVIKGILELQPQRISYVSCDPATLARDLKKLIAASYQVQRISAFDMFPQTHHVESVVQLSRATTWTT
ncbi:MAG TPA: class I SAM-dependent RNA methyltransferase [Pyrinomonadaceae bacterium]|nr:class I SAM-dependent RNA methyltransferase [Pyrinomonadaceae bacterium]